MSEIKLHRGQTEIFRALFLEKTARFITGICSRGWGKSFFAAVAAMKAIDELMRLDRSVPNKNVYIIAPTYDQVTDIYYPILVYELGVDTLCVRPPRRDLGRFQFPNNVELRLISFEAVERARGKGAYFIVNDEISSWSKGMTAKAAWEGILQPCIITRWSEKRAKKFNAPSPGRALTITTPKGYNFAYDMFHYPEVDPQWQSFQFDYHSSPYLDPVEIERIKHTIDPIEFASEYLASFEDSGTNVFYCFKRKEHVNKVPDFYPPKYKDGQLYRKGEDVHAMIDFNVGIQATSFWAKRGQKMHCIHEFKGHPNTEALAKDIMERFKDHNVFAYPDPSGRARKSSAPIGVTDLSILKNQGLKLRVKKKAPPIADSVQAVNRKLLTAGGEMDVQIDPRCEGVIKSIERTSWLDRNPDTLTLDKTEGMEHFSDGVRYGFDYLFPIQTFSNKTYRGSNF